MNNVVNANSNAKKYSGYVLEEFGVRNASITLFDLLMTKYFLKRVRLVISVSVAAAGFHISGPSKGHHLRI